MPPWERVCDKWDCWQLCCVAVLGTLPTNSKAWLLTRAGKKLRVPPGFSCSPLLPLGKSSPKPTPSVYLSPCPITDLSIGQIIVMSASKVSWSWPLPGPGSLFLNRTASVFILPPLKISEWTFSTSVHALCSCYPSYCTKYIFGEYTFLLRIRWEDLFL